MNSEPKIEAPEHVTAMDHESEENLLNIPSPDAPSSLGWHHASFRVKRFEKTHHGQGGGGRNLTTV
jgi:hypothetical protein